MVDPHEIPTDVLAVLFEHMPNGNDEDVSNSDAWRSVLAHVLTRWERDKDTIAAVGGAWAHQCAWVMLSVRHNKILGMMQTFVLQRCAGCGELKTVQLQGEWTLAEIQEGRQSLGRRS